LACSIDDDETPLTIVDRVFGGHFLTVFRCKCCDTVRRFRS